MSAEPHRRPARLNALAALLLAFPGFAFAQSLQELYEAARAFDATFLAARSLADSARYRVEQVEALNRPTAALVANVTRNQLDLPIVGYGGNNGLGATVSGRLPLFNRGNAAAIEQARKSLLSSQADLETAEQDLMVRVAQAYFDVLGAQDTLGTTKSSQASIAEQLASAKRNFEVGTATITDTREAQARFDLATAQGIAADNDLQTKRIALESLVGRTGVNPKPLKTPAVLPATVPGDSEAWVTQADASHPTIRRARVAFEVAQLDTERARAARLPTVDAIASVGNTNSNGLGVSLPGYTKQATVGLQLNWNVFNGGSVENRIKETLVLEDKTRNDFEAARRGVAQGTRVAYFGVQSGLAQVKALEAAESSSQLALEATQLGYKVGVRVNLDVLNSQSQLFSTQRDLARARYDVLVNGLRLRQAAGVLTPGDVAAVNSLLTP